MIFASIKPEKGNVNYGGKGKERRESRQKRLIHSVEASLSRVALMKMLFLPRNWMDGWIERRNGNGLLFAWYKLTPVIGKTKNLESFSVNGPS
jgi:hypothetical protein